MSMPKAHESTLEACGSESVPMRVHHVGWAVRSIERALRYFLPVMGFRQLSEPIEVPSQKVRVCFLEMGGSNLLELVEGLAPDSPVERIVAQTGGGVYHLCFQVDEMDAAIAALRRKGFFRLKRFELSAHGMRRFAFMLTPDRQLIELCEPDGSPS